MKEAVLYKFYGNFIQGGRWSKPEIGFSGEFIANEDGVIHGYCDELYDTKDEYKKRFIVGRLIKNGISFAKLTNSSDILPLIYSSKNLFANEEAKEDIDENALWQPFTFMDPIMVALLQGKRETPKEVYVVLLGDPEPAKLTVEKIQYSKGKEEKIRERLAECNKDLIINNELFAHPEICKFLSMDGTYETGEEGERDVILQFG
jgi:hypothetical protein